MAYQCENRACMVQLDEDTVDHQKDKRGYFFACPVCDTRNVLKNVGTEEAPRFINQNIV